MFSSFFSTDRGMSPGKEKKPRHCTNLTPCLTVYSQNRSVSEREQTWPHRRRKKSIKNGKEEETKACAAAAIAAAGARVCAFESQREVWPLKTERAVYFFAFGRSSSSSSGRTHARTDLGNNTHMQQQQQRKRKKKHHYLDTQSLVRRSATNHCYRLFVK